MVGLAAYLQWQEGYFITWALSEPKLNVWIRFNQRLFIWQCPLRQLLCLNESICEKVKTIHLFTLTYYLKGVLKKMKNMWLAGSSYWLKTSLADCHGMTYFYGTTAKNRVVSPSKELHYNEIISEGLDTDGMFDMQMQSIQQNSYISL